MWTSRQHFANELYKWKVWRGNDLQVLQNPRRQEAADALSWRRFVVILKLLSITMQGKWNQPPTVRKMRTVVYTSAQQCRPEGIPRNMDALPARAWVSLTWGVRATPPTACVRALGRMQPCNGGALFTWSRASVTHCHFHYSVYFSCIFWEGGGWGGQSSHLCLLPFFMPSNSLSIFIFLPTSWDFLFSSAFSLCLPTCHLSISSTLLSSCLPPSLPPLSRLSHCCSLCQDMNNWGVLSLVSRWWDGCYGSIGALLESPSACRHLSG